MPIAFWRTRSAGPSVASTVLTFVREYILADEVCRLGEFDLRFADLLPDDDDWEGEGFGIRRVTPAFRP